ncbi:MAG: FecR family protein [Lysobacter sp.]
MAGSRQIEQAAAEWLARRDGGEWSADMQGQFDAWLAQSTAHRVEFLRLRAAWAEGGRLKALAAGAEPGLVPARGQWVAAAADRGEPAYEGEENETAPAAPAPERVFARRATASRRFGLRSVAMAGVVAVVAVSSWWGWTQYGAVERSEYRTAMGRTDTVSLADGSRATLSSDSHIDVALSRTQRQVVLQRGEAFFDVAKDPGRPFAVEAGGRRVVAVGTHFSVRRDGADLRVVVTEGTVRLESEPIGGHRQPITLLPAGSIATAGANGVLVRSLSAQEAERWVDWRNGYVVFRDTPLAEAADEFNRYNARKLVIGDAAAGQLRVGGNFRWSNADVFVGLIEQALPVRAERLPDRIVLHSR